MPEQEETFAMTKNEEVTDINIKMTGSPDKMQTLYCDNLHIYPDPGGFTLDFCQHLPDHQVVKHDDGSIDLERLLVVRLYVTNHAMIEILAAFNRSCGNNTKDENINDDIESS